MSTEHPVSGLSVVATSHSVTEVLDRLQAIAAHRGLTIFTRIDFSGDAERAGLHLRPTALLILGNTKGGTPLMVASPTAAIDLPLKVLAWTDDKGTWVGFNEPDYLQSRHHIPAHLVPNIAGLAKLVAEAAGDAPLP